MELHGTLMSLTVAAWSASDLGCIHSKVLGDWSISTHAPHPCRSHLGAKPHRAKAPFQARWMGETSMETQGSE